MTRALKSSPPARRATTAGRGLCTTPVSRATGRGAPNVKVPRRARGRFSDPRRVARPSFAGPSSAWFYMHARMEGDRQKEHGAERTKGDINAITERGREGGMRDILRAERKSIWIQRICGGENGRDGRTEGRIEFHREDSEGGREESLCCRYGGGGRAIMWR